MFGNKRISERLIYNNKIKFYFLLSIGIKIDANERVLKSETIRKQNSKIGDWIIIKDTKQSTYLIRMLNTK